MESTRGNQYNISRLGLAAGAFLISITLLASRPPANDLHTVTIQEGGRTIQVLSGQMTLAERLEISGIVLRPHDIVIPRLSTEIHDDMQVRVYHRSRKIKSAHLTKPRQRRIPSRRITKGREIKIHSGNRFSKKDKRSPYTSDDVILIGKGRKTPKKKVVQLLSTAYSPSAHDCAPFDDGVTAIGLHAGYGVVATDPKIIPLGTRLFVEGYGYAIAGDVGGAIRRKRIDLCFNTYEEAVNYGFRRVNVYLLD